MGLKSALDRWLASTTLKSTRLISTHMVWEAVAIVNGSGSIWTLAGTLTTHAEYPLKLQIQILCVFPVQPHIFAVPLYVICDYYIHKTDLIDSSSFKQIWKKSKYLLPLESGNLQLEQTKFPVF